MTADLLLIRRRRPVGEPDSLRPVGSAGAATTDGSVGAGRALHALAEAGVAFEAVSQLIVPADATAEALRGIDFDRRFETIALGSHLMNLPDPALRLAHLELAARLVAAGGATLVEHHPVDWLATAADVRPVPGAEVGMVDVRREPPFVSAVSVFDVGGRLVRQPFIARVLTEDELAAALDEAGLRIDRRLAPTWLRAVPAGS